jgi:hypothetical protein
MEIGSVTVHLRGDLSLTSAAGFKTYDRIEL